MYELHEIYANCRQDDEEFLQRVKVVSLPCAKFYSPLDRDDVSDHWMTQLEEFDARIKKKGADASRDLTDNARIIGQFARKTADILALVADTLHPTAIEQIEQLVLE
jgi:hypothetical protein